MILPAWFDYLEDHFSYQEVQFKKFSLPVKTTFPVAENIHETPALISGWLLVSDHKLMDSIIHRCSDKGHLSYHSLIHSLFCKIIIFCLGRNTH